MDEDGDETRERAIANERFKLTATFVNGAGIAIFAIGGVAPFVSLAAGSSNASILSILVTSVVSLVVSAAAHIGARRILGGLRP